QAVARRAVAVVRQGGTQQRQQHALRSVLAAARCVRRLLGGDRGNQLEHLEHRARRTRLAFEYLSPSMLVELVEPLVQLRIVLDQAQVRRMDRAGDTRIDQRPEIHRPDDGAILQSALDRLRGARVTEAEPGSQQQNPYRFIGSIDSRKKLKTSSVLLQF